MTQLFVTIETSLLLFLVTYWICLDKRMLYSYDPQLSYLFDVSRKNVLLFLQSLIEVSFTITDANDFISLFSGDHHDGGRLQHSERARSACGDQPAADQHQGGDGRAVANDVGRVGGRNDVKNRTERSTIAVEEEAVQAKGF